MLDFFISSAHAAEGAPADAGGGMFQLLMLVGIFVLFYFIAIRPNQKRQKEHKNMMDALSVGDEVATNGGILGKVTKVQESFVVLEVSESVELKFQKYAIHTVLPKGTIKAING